MVIKGLLCDLVGCGVVVGFGNGGLVVFGGDGVIGLDLIVYDVVVIGLVGVENIFYLIVQDSKFYVYDLSMGVNSFLFLLSGQWFLLFMIVLKIGYIVFVFGKMVFVLLISVSEVGVNDFQFIEYLSSLFGLVFLLDGRWFVVSYYDGIILWFLDGLGKGEILWWKGYYIGVFWLLDGCFIVFVIQECEFYVWDFVGGKDYWLGGYFVKIYEFEWIGFDDGLVKLVCFGVDVIIVWLFGDVGFGCFFFVEIGYVYLGCVISVVLYLNCGFVVGGYIIGIVLIGGF